MVFDVVLYQYSPILEIFKSKKVSFFEKNGERSAYS